MPFAAVNGISLHFEEYGTGDPVVLVTGSGGRGRLWTPHQVPALVAAGYRAITVDNRGVPPTASGPGGFTVQDMAADIAGLIEGLRIGPCRVVGFSLGGIIVQQLLLARPDLVRQAVLMATRGRVDVLRAALAAAEAEFVLSGVTLPPRYAAVLRAMHYLSPSTQNHDQRIKDWLELFEMSPADPAIGRAHRDLDVPGDQLEQYRAIRARCLVIGFADDLITPPRLCREVAEHIPGSAYAEVAGCGHYGYLEEPGRVNSLILDFFSG